MTGIDFPGRIEMYVSRQVSEGGVEPGICIEDYVLAVQKTEEISRSFQVCRYLLSSFGSQRLVFTR